MLGKDKIAICAILPALKMGAGETMPEKWQNDWEFSRAGFLPCKMAGNFSALAFCRADEQKIFPRWLSAMQNGWEFFRSAFLPCKWTGDFPAQQFCNGNVKAISPHGLPITQNDMTSPCIAIFQENAMENKDISEELVAKPFMKQTFIKLGMKVSEVADLSQNICDLYVTMTAKLDDSYLQNVMTDLKDLSERISCALKHTRIVSSLEDLDLQRDHCVRAILNLKRAYKKLSDDTIQTHWTALKPVLEDYIPSILEGNYQSKTALVSSLLKALAEPDMAAHVTALPGLALAVGKLDEAQTAFVGKRLEYQQLALDGQSESATELKEQIIETVNGKLVVHLAAMSKVNPETYGNFTTLVTNLIKSSNLKVVRRRDKKETPSEIPTKE